MKWPFIGIIAVVCLQMGFTVFNALDRSIESLVAVNELTNGTISIADISEDLESFTVPVESANNRSAKRPAKAIFVSAKTNVRVKPEPAISQNRQFTATQKPLQSTVITYPRVIRAVSKYDVRRTIASVEPQTEKRSFFSKSISVLKKPYGWLKALGSRIN